MGLCPGGYKYRDISRGEVRHGFFIGETGD